MINMLKWAPVLLACLAIPLLFLDDEQQSEYAQNDSWQLLAAVKMLEARGELIQDKEEKTLDGKPFSLIGYIYPLDKGKEQSHFLLSPYSPSCGFCSIGGIASTVEVFCQEPIAYSQEPVTLTGMLKFAEHEQLGLYFQLLDAELH